MRWQIEPMARWPYPNTAGRKANPFRSKFDNTLTLLEDELEHLKVTGAVAVRVVTDDVSIRQDGMLRARAVVHHPGVVLSFTSATAGSLTYPCDRFTGRWYGEVDWQVNLRAIALGLEALRKLDRYGITQHGQQYAGWRAIEPGSTNGFSTTDDAIRWLREITGETGPHIVLGQLLRRAARLVHPDKHDGDHTLWNRYDTARQLLEGEANLYA